MVPANLTIVPITGSTLVKLTNNTKKIAPRAKRRILENELRQYERTIQDDYKYQYQQGLIEFEQCFIHQTHNGISFLDMIKNYFSSKTEKTLRDITNNFASYRLKLVRRRRRLIARKLSIISVLVDIEQQVQLLNDLTKLGQHSYDTA
jgi:hypothetical protein